MPSRPHIAFLKDTDTPPRADLSHNYSGASADIASFVAPSNIIVTKFRMMRRDNDDTEAQSFGDAGNLSNGLEILIRDAVDVTLVDLTAGEPIEATGDLLKFGDMRTWIPTYDFEAAASHSLTEFVMDFSKIAVSVSDPRPGFMLRVGEQISVVLDDDLSDLNELMFSVEYYEA